MGSHLDRAFLKAYTRSQSAPVTDTDAAKPHSRPSDFPQPHLRPSDFPQPVPASAKLGETNEPVIWSDLGDQSFFRVDMGHSPSPRNKPASFVPPSAAAPRLHTAHRSPVQPPTSQRAAAPSRPVPPRTSPTDPAFSPASYPHLDPNLPRSEEPRLDEAHPQRTWTPPTVEEPQEYYRVHRDVEQAEAFAQAKREALATQSVAEPREQNEALAVPNGGRQAFEAVWEVDAFGFSDTIVALFGDARLMKSIGTPLDRAVATGLRSLLITSAARSEGRTSVAIGIAVSAAAAGLKVALVEADSSAAGLADTLRLDVQHDWIEAIRGGVALDEVAIHSIEDQLTVMPIVSESGRTSYTAGEFDQMLTQLSRSFDLVIVDGAPWFDDSHPLQQSTAIDAAIVVVDARHHSPDRISRIQNDLRLSGVAGLGIVENFV